MPQLFTNNARALLASGITDSATSLTVEASKADLFPTANTGTGSVPAATNWFKATLQDATGNVEIVYVRTRTAGSGVFSNVIRGQEGTTARSFSAGTVVGLRITAADVEGSIAAAASSVQLSGNQTIGGNKTFSGDTVLNGKQAISKTTTVTVGTVGPSDQWELSNNGSGACVMSFHRSGAYAINMGLDADNVFRLGGWSQGSNVHRWTSDTSGNFTALGNITAGGNVLVTSNINAASYNGGQLAGMRNKIINGKMEIAQRGTSFGAAGLDGSYTLDRWVVGNSSAATFTVSQQLGVDKLQNCVRVVVGTTDTSIAAGDQALFQQNIEGFNAFDLIGTTFTISFWVRSSVTGTYCIALRNSAFDRSYIATYTINAIDTWEYKTITVTGGLPASGGTWNFTNGSGLRVAWTLACGSTFQTTAGAWQAGNFLGTSAQANFLATATNTFQLTGVQLEVGSVATPFEHRPIGAELELCQRYYEVGGSDILQVATAGSQNLGGKVFYRTTKRAAASITLNRTFTFNATASSASSNSVLDGFTINCVSSGAGAVQASDGWIAPSEL